MVKTAAPVEIRQGLVHIVPLIHIALGHVGGGEFAARELLVRLSRDVEGVGDADSRLPSLRYRVAEVDGLFRGEVGRDQRGIVIPTVAANMHGLRWIDGAQLLGGSVGRNEGLGRSQGDQLQAMGRRRRRCRRGIPKPQAMVDSRPCIYCIIIGLISTEARDDCRCTGVLYRISGLFPLGRECQAVRLLPLTPCALVDQFNRANFLL